MNAISREDVLRAYPLMGHLESIGVQLHGQGNQRTSNRCAGHEHRNDHLCVTVDTQNEIWHCNDCDTGGSVIDWLAIERGADPRETFKQLAIELGNGNGNHNGNGHTQRPRRNGEPEGVISEIYEYQDENGQRLFEVVRMDPKDFRQRHMEESGKWAWNMKGVRRVLYCLPDVLAAQEVWIVEGEKDANTLRNLNFVATCNVGGAGKWLDAYTEALADKDIVLCGDNDDAGIKHMIMVGESLSGKVRSTRTVKIPSPHKDVTEFVESKPDQTEAFIAMVDLQEKATQLYRGVDVPVFSLAEIEPRYRAFVQSMQTTALNLSTWLPSLQNRVRSIVPGELIMFIADTGVGKTALLSNLAIHASPLTTLFCELELPETLLFERIVAAHTARGCREIEEVYTMSTTDSAMPLGFSGLSHIHVCPRSRLSSDDLEKIILRAELKIGSKPQLVLLDYIQLVSGMGKSRYEKTSDIAESLKVIAKQTGTIIVVASQVARKDRDEDPEIQLHDGKDSGSIENSSGLVIGAWRDKDDPATLWLKICKNTKGRSGHKIECNFNGETMKITEKSRIDPEDVPQPTML